MSTPNFDALVEKVRSWANRDSDVLPDSIITDFLDYSADFCYRNLRIPPMEYTYSYPNVTSSSVGETALQIPPDFSELISLYRVDVDGNKYALNKRLVETEFENKNTTNPKNSFIVKGEYIVFYPAAELGDKFVIHYYRRLPDLDATFLVNATNVNVGNCTQVVQGTTGAVEYPLGSGTYYIGNEVYNWLKDENERALLWGALSHAFEYLGEDNKALKYAEKQMQAINELNQEEKYRRVKGAVNTVTYEVSELLG